ncbi:MAG: hypothetical protein BGO78_01545 [Chloroflexi bacterium 44-23]|nr:MAG: hypothetical protein BGO78_01545 [Chloroflexi bacterium 44-23]
MEIKRLFEIAFGILIGLIIAALILLINRPTNGDSIILLPPPSPKPIIVNISGAVTNPGVYELEKGSRLNDLLQLAGGANVGDLSNYNLAAELYDGQHIHIENSSESDLKSSTIDIKVNINEADKETLMSLPGIGETKALEIIKYRDENGFYEEIKDILNVPGIGEYTFELIKDLIVTNQIYE